MGTTTVEAIAEVLVISGPISYRAFVQLVKCAGCTIDRKGSHGRVMYNGRFISRFAVTHGKNAVRELVLNCYVKQFLCNKP